MRFLFSRALGVISTLLLSRFVHVHSQACVLKVPADPLTALGLSTPYVVTGCTQADAPTFVEGVIVDLDAGTIKAYSPLVIDAGKAAAAAPTKISLGNNVVVGLWFGTNGDSLTLQGTIINGVDSVLQGNCVNGGGGGATAFSQFGQFSACNARAFFDAAQAVIANKQVTLPPLGNDFTGLPCPTTRDFGLVDQDESDNVVTQYLVLNNGQSAQNIPDNVAKFAAQKTATTVVSNGSDEGLLARLLDPPIGCSPWKIPDMADKTNKQMVSTLATNELHARLQGKPVAFLPAGHAMTLTADGNPDINKLNAYRTSVNQAPIRNLNQANTVSYCKNMYSVMGAGRILLWSSKTVKAASPDPAFKNLAAFMVGRYNAAVGADNLNCVALLNKPSPLLNNVDKNGNFIFPANAKAAAAGNDFHIQETPITTAPASSKSNSTTAPPPPPPLPAWILEQAPMPSMEELRVLAGITEDPAFDTQWGEPAVDLQITPDAFGTPDPTVQNPPAPGTTSTMNFQAMSFGIGIGAGVIAMALIGGVAYVVKRKQEQGRTASSSVSHPAINFARISSPANAMV